MELTKERIIEILTDWYDETECLLDGKRNRDIKEVIQFIRGWYFVQDPEPEYKDSD